MAASKQNWYLPISRKARPFTDGGFTGEEQDVYKWNKTRHLPMTGKELDVYRHRTMMFTDTKERTHLWNETIYRWRKWNTRYLRISKTHCCLNDKTIYRWLASGWCLRTSNNDVYKWNKTRHLPMTWKKLDVYRHRTMMFTDTKERIHLWNETIYRWRKWNTRYLRIANLLGNLNDKTIYRWLTSSWCLPTSN